MSGFRRIAQRVIVVLVLSGAAGYAADHRDAPGVLEDGRTDINDVYVFQSPDNPHNTVLIMTVNPLAGVLSPTTFHPKADYILNVDTDGDAVEDFQLIARFSKSNDAGVQRVALFRSPPRGHGQGAKLAEGLTGQIVGIKGGGKFRADVFDDPFFFDLDGFKHGLQFTGTNFFAGLNVTAIVIELPSDSLLDSGHKPKKHHGHGHNSHEEPDTMIGVWGVTQVGGERIDRMGRPAINTVLIPPALKDAFNDGDPADDQEDFRDIVLDTLMSLGNDAMTANALADVLLPDILTFDTSNAGGFLNGRRLEDDVIDIELNLLTGGAITGDGVANDSTFLNVFPYLAAPNAAP
jgi:hypothetical protein